MGSPHRLAAFSRAPPGSEEGVGAGVPGGQEQPSLGVAGQALRLERRLRLGVGEGPGDLESLKPWWQALGKAARLQGPRGAPACFTVGRPRLRAQLRPAGALPASPSLAPRPEPPSVEASDARRPLSGRAGPR